MVYIVLYCIILYLGRSFLENYVQNEKQGKFRFNRINGNYNPQSTVTCKFYACNKTNDLFPLKNYIFRPSDIDLTFYLDFYTCWN